MWGRVQWRGGQTTFTQQLVTRPPNVELKGGRRAAGGGGRGRNVGVSIGTGPNSPRMRRRLPSLLGRSSSSSSSQRRCLSTVQPGRPDEPPFRLRFLGFCGVDDSADTAELVELSSRLEIIEWGFLFRKDLQGQPRYPSDAFCKQLGAQAGVDRLRKAGHLCSGYAGQVLGGDHDFVRHLVDSLGVQRVQINPTGANDFDSSRLGSPEVLGGMQACLQAMPDVEFILQRNEETQPLWQPLQAEVEAGRHSNLSFLFDESKGLGRVSSQWPSPPTLGTKVGYAGGLGPHNLS